MDSGWKWLTFHCLEFNHMATPHGKDGCKLVKLYEQAEEVMGLVAPELLYVTSVLS